MYKVLFTFYLLVGRIQPDGQNDGRPMYKVPSQNIEYAYKAELIDYLKTKKFTYNEDL